MIKAPITLQELRRKIYATAKAEKTKRFWGLYVHVHKLETLHEAYKMAKANNGAPGIDGVTFEAIEAAGVEGFLRPIQKELERRDYRPMRCRRKEIPKEGGKVRILSIPSIRDRVVQGALRLILEPIFEADFQPGSFGYRPKRSAHQAVEGVSEAIVRRKRHVIDIDLRAFLDPSSYCTLFHERSSKRLGCVAFTLILKPFRLPRHMWTASSSPRFTRCNTVWRETPSTLVASIIGM